MRALHAVGAGVPAGRLSDASPLRGRWRILRTKVEALAQLLVLDKRRRVRALHGVIIVDEPAHARCEIRTQSVEVL